MTINKFASVSTLVLATFLASGAYAADIHGKSMKDSDGPSIFGDTPNGAHFSGLYVGIHGGYAWGDAATTNDIADWCGATDAACIAKYVGPFDYEADGAFGGLTVGYNVTLRNILLGVEVDAGYMDLQGDAAVASSAGSPHYQALSLDGGWYGVAAGRLGLVFDRLLVYGKAGFAMYDGEAAQATTRDGFSTYATDTFTGWAYGGGIEYAIGNGLSLKAEYLRFDFGDENGGQLRDSDSYDFNNSTDLTVDTFKVGINRRF